MRGDDDQFLGGIELGPSLALEAAFARDHRDIEHRVDPGIAGDDDRGGSTPSRRRFSAAFSVAAKCRVRQVRRQDAIHLFRKRLTQIARAEAGLDVRHREC